MVPPWAWSCQVDTPYSGIFVFGGVLHSLPPLCQPLLPYCYNGGWTPQAPPVKSTRRATAYSQERRVAVPPGQAVGDPLVIRYLGHTTGAKRLLGMGKGNHPRTGGQWLYEAHRASETYMAI